MFTAYFDDSGTHPKHRIGVLAGFAAANDEWARFEVEWGTLVADPKVRYFKAHDCDKGDGKYLGVPEAARRAVYDRAFDIVCQHSLMCVAVAGRKQDFEGQWEKYQRPEFDNTKFEISVSSTLMTLALLFETHWIKDRVALICENGKAGDNVIIANAYHKIIGRQEWAHLEGRFMGPPAFHRKEDFYGLQAADLLAYELGIEYARRTDGKDVPVREGWLRLLEHGRRNKGALRLMTRHEGYSFGFGGEDCGT